MYFRIFPKVKEQNGNIFRVLTFKISFWVCLGTEPTY